MDIHDRQPRHPRGGDMTGLKRRLIIAAAALGAVAAAAVSLGLASGRVSIPGITMPGSDSGGASSSSSSATSTSSGPPPTPPSHPSYTLEYASVISEYDLTAVMYRHTKTDAQLFAVIPNTYTGQDKSFGISFRTNPTDSTGVAHIVEHSVLSGSRKYPVKDPFLHLLKGSLQTFLNAMTYADRTVYPVASRNRQDFRNLADVYLDAVFHPRCVEEEWVLKQEGWRYELDDDTDDLVYRGVVMSEMMGAYSDPDEIMYQTSQTLLFPDTTYRYDSGGDPLDIPKLTFDDFKDFYRRHYHPTNSKTYVNGDVQDVRMALELVDTYLGEYDVDPEVRRESEVPYQAIKFTRPVRERRPYASSSEGDDGDDEGDDDDEGDAGGGGGQGQGHMLSVKWLLHDSPLDPLTELALVVLDDLLLANPSSVLRKALLDSGLGDDVMDDGVEDEMIQHTFTVGLKGIQNSDDVVKVEKVIMDTLGKVAEQGFEMDDVSASLNSVEFHLREFNTGSYPRSVIIFLEIMSKWNYDQDPRTALLFEETLSALKSEISANNSKIFQNLVRTYLVGNTHRVVLEFYPSATLEAEQLAEEKKRLHSIRSNLSEEELNKIDETAKSLAELQERDDPPEAVASIPSLSLGDLDARGAEHPISVHASPYDKEGEGGGGMTLVTHAVPSSSGVAYVDFGLDISSLSLDDASLLPFFARMMTETGTSALSPLELDRRVGMHTGGIDVDPLVIPIHPAGIDDSVVAEGTHLRTMLFVRGKCTVDKSSHLFTLFRQILTDANFAGSQQKAQQILGEMLSELRTDVPSRGNSFALRRIASRYSVSGYIREQMTGVSQVNTVQGLSNTAENDWPKLLERLENMRRTILGGNSRANAVLNLTGDRGVLDAIERDVRDFASDDIFKGGPGAAGDDPPKDFHAKDHPWSAPALAKMKTDVPPLGKKNEGVVASTKVNYVARGGLLYSSSSSSSRGGGERIPGSAAVVSRYLQNGYLWEHVRVRNGAYGSGSTFDRDAGGTLILTSYRDPELGKTLEVFDGAADELLRDADAAQGGALAGRDSAALTRAVIGAVGHLDGSSPPPDEVGWESLLQYLRGESPEFRQRWRTDILKTTVEDFRDFASRLKQWTDPSSAAVGSQGAFDEYNSSEEGRSNPMEIILTI